MEKKFTGLMLSEFLALIEAAAGNATATDYEKSIVTLMARSAALRVVATNGQPDYTILTKHYHIIKRLAKTESAEIERAFAMKTKAAAS